MGYWETNGATDEWYTPAHVFEALGCTFDLDVANAAMGGAHVPCRFSYGTEGLERPWEGFVWMNPPFGGRNGLVPWLNKFFDHGDGIALTPDRTSTDWWQDAARRADAVLFVHGKIQFERPDGTVGKSPSNGTTLFAAGDRGVKAILRAADAGLGVVQANHKRSAA